MKRYFVDFAMGFTWDILDAKVVQDGLKAHTFVCYVYEVLWRNPCIQGINTCNDNSLVCQHNQATTIIAMIVENVQRKR